MTRSPLTRLVRAAAGLVLVLALAADSAAAAARPTAPPVPVFPLAEEFRVAFEGEILGPPLAFGGDILLSLASGRVLAVDAAGNKLRWAFTAKDRLAASAAAGPGFVVVADRGGRLTRLGADGRVVWERPVPGIASAPLVLSEGSIMGVFDGRTLRVFDAATGGERWSYTADRDVLSAPRPWKGRVLLATAARTIVLAAPPGQVALGFGLTDLPSGHILVDGDRLFVGLANGTIECRNLGKGPRRWVVKTGGILVGNPIADRTRIYFLTDSRVLFALDKKSGNVLWWRSLPGRAFGEPVPAGPHLLASALAPVLTAFDPATGKKTAETDLKLDLVAPPLVLGERIVAAVRDPVTGAGALLVLKSKPPPPAAPKKKSTSGGRS